MGGNTLTLAVKEKPKQRLLEQFASSHPQLVIDGSLEEQDHVVVRRKPGQVEESFHVWRPMRAFENNDLEPDLASIVPAPCWILQVVLESNPPSEDWELANSLARFIATTCDGAVFYDELGKIVWPEGAQKKAKTPKKERTVDVATLE
jgi:hypothetical protein